jgi:hypothetical protein
MESLKSYIKYRTLELDYQESQIGEPGGINMGSHIAKRNAIEMARWTLRELQRLAEWDDAGEPAVFEPPMSADERAFWAKAKARGVKVPDDIAAQL